MRTAEKERSEPPVGALLDCPPIHGTESTPAPDCPKTSPTRRESREHTAPWSARARTRGAALINAVRVCAPWRERRDHSCSSGARAPITIRASALE